MKTRCGFVSNSSSSSFILAVQEDLKPCKHCGRRDLGLYELIDGKDSAWNCNDTSIIHANREEVLENQQRIMKSLKDQLDDLKFRKDPNEKCFPGGWSTVGEYRKSLENNIQDTKQLIARIKKAKGNVFECQVSYRNDLLNQMIKDLTAAGRCTILLQENE